jgi:hypothetical protein
MHRTRILLALGAALAIATAAAASYPDFEQITVAGSAVGLTSAKITPTSAPPMTFAQCQVETASLRWSWADPAKVTVTSSVGNLANAGDWITLISREQLLNFRAIRVSASAQLNCHYVAVP